MTTAAAEPPVRAFCDTSVLIRYWADDDPPRALSAARLIDSDDRQLVVSTVVLLETVHSLRTVYGLGNPEIAELLIGFLTRANVELADADKGFAVEALRWSADASARRIPDGLIAAAALRADCDVIVSFDQAFRSPSVPVRLL